MYCKNCGKQLDEGEICLCEILGEDQQKKPEKKMTPWKKILVGVIAGLVSFTLTSFVIPAIFEKMGEKDTPESSQTDVFEGIEGDFVLASSGAEYTKGVVKGNTYSNLWMNVKFTADSRFVNGTEEDYESYESLLYDCGAYFLADDDGDDISVIFYDAGSTTVIEYAEECLDIWEQSVRDAADEIYSAAVKKTITYRREARVVEIAGEEYLGVFLIEDFPDSYTVVYGDFCAMKDGRIIDIGFTADSIDEAVSLVKTFETCNGYDI